MHVQDGILASSVLAGGWAVAGVTTAVCLRTVKEEQIPRTAVLTACFFVASTIHVPLWGTSIHLVLSGLCGVILGPAAFLAVLPELLPQVVVDVVSWIPTVMAMRVMRISAWNHASVGAFLPKVGYILAWAVALVLVEVWLLRRNDK